MGAPPVVVVVVSMPVRVTIRPPLVMICCVSARIHSRQGTSHGTAGRHRWTESEKFVRPCRASANDQASLGAHVSVSADSRIGRMGVLRTALNLQSGVGKVLRRFVP